MSFSDILKAATNVIQKPQSVSTSILGEISGKYNDDRDFIRQYEEAVVPNTEENAIRYANALRTVGTSGAMDTGGINALLSPGALLGSAKRGLTENFRPSEIAPSTNPNVANKILGTTENIALDPMMLLSGSGAGSKLTGMLPEGGKLAELARGASSVGKIEDATKLARVGQLGRQAYQATLGAGEYGPAGVLAATGLIHGGENVAAKYLPKIAMKLLEQNVNPVGAEAVVANATSDVPSVLELMAGPRVTALGPVAEQPDLMSILGQGPKQLGTGPTIAGELMPPVKVPNVQVPIVPPMTGAAEQAGLGLTNRSVNVMDPNNEINQLIAALHDPRQRVQLMQKLSGRNPIVFPGG